MAVTHPPEGSRRFKYRAATADGRIVRGSLLGTSEHAARERLAGRGLMPLRLQETQGNLLAGRVQAHDLAVVFRNVAALVASGVPIERAFAVSETLVPARVAAVLAEVRYIIREGRSVGEALAAQGDVLPRSIVGVIAAGERASGLAKACESAAVQLEHEAQLRSQVRSALAYPALILVVGVVTVLIMGTVVVPRFAEVLGELGAEVPSGTRALLMVSESAQRFVPFLALGCVGGGLTLCQVVRNPAGRERFDRFLLAVPVVGGLRQEFASARLCRALGAMLTNGMPLLEALDCASEAAADVEIGRRLARAREAVAQGTPLTRALEAEKALSPLALQIVGLGEASGRMGPMTSRAGIAADEQAQRNLRTAVTLLEPALVVTLGLVVAGVAAALLQAVYSIRPG